MRMWMVEPKIMCRKHLLGEHVETHMFLGTLRKKKKIKGYLNNNLFEPILLRQRHDLLVDEMKRRGMNHSSPLIVTDEYDYLSKKDLCTEIDKKKAKKDLLSRCEECRRMNDEYEEKKARLMVWM
jgi:hypothetical protein